ncbi:ATP-binding protein [Lichenihabitans sp. Uapishka_5]|uniref:sensor histidine kinase n=1 Tax=Lichenihabitans sp. Uapishka_5 TaxID=3037302 RepID=UPI0029E7D254|nr:ATP-binding protein [Lichenihabitans sp. Uapishka_5]MDX7951848.1 ATP-binding protein [Lichenihabitans sp. Uapishka_5]
MAAALGMTIFCLDAFTKADLSVAALYVLVLLIAVGGGRATHRSTIVGWSLACGTLTVVGYAVYALRGAGPLAGAHAAINLTILIIATILLLHAYDVEMSGAASEQSYRRVFDTLAIAIWEHDFTPVAQAVADLRSQGVSDLKAYLAEHPAFVIAARRMVRITDVNATALAMMGVPSKDMFFSHLAGFLPETDESFSDCILAIDERRPLFQAETRVVPFVGDPIDIVVTFGLGPDASLDRVPGSVLDVSQRKRLEAQVVRTREELARVRRTSALGALSATLAHEIHQPLSAVQSYADAAGRWLNRSEPDLAEAHQALQGLGRAMTCARGVMHRVRGLAGSLPLDPSPIDLTELIPSALALVAHEVAESGSRVRLNVPLYPVNVLGDEILLKQVLVDLIGNAVRAMAGTPAVDRLVDLDVHVEASRVRVRLSDRGEGWSEAVLADAFQNFYTSERSEVELGLAICRMVVHRHDGALTLSNRVDGGASVEIILPLHRAPGTPTDGEVTTTA